MSKKNKVGYYSIIPSKVRYDDSLTPNAKLMYGELTALSNKQGYAFARNEYFAKLYGVNKRTISRWISQLKGNDYIQVLLSETAKGTERKISIKGMDSIVPRGGQNDPDTPDKNSETGEDNNVPHNSDSSSNITSDTTTTTTIEEVVEIKTYWENIFGTPVDAKLDEQIESLLDSFSKKEIKKAIYNRSQSSYYKEAKPELRNIPKCFFAYPVTVRTDFNRIVDAGKEKDKLEMTFSYKQMMNLFQKSGLGGANGSGYSTDDIFIKVEGKNNQYRIKPGAIDLIQL